MEPKKFYFRDGPYLQTLKGLYKALSLSEAFITLLGNANTGKSSLCRLLNNYLQRKGYRTVYFHYAIESPDMLRTMLARELDIPESVNFPRLVEDALLHGDGKPVVLIFDDAHLLTDVTLLEIYRLAEIQANNKRLLNILLCGEPALEQHLLSRREFKNLLLHISNRFVLEPMDVESTSQFIHGYLLKAGLPELQIEPAAMTYLWKSCKGFPGPAALICRTMVRARAGQAEMTPMSKQELTLLIRGSAEVQSVPGLSVVSNNQWFLLGPIAAVVVIASMGLIYQQLRTEVDPASETVESAGPSPFTSAQPQLPVPAPDPGTQPAEQTTLLSANQPVPSEPEPVEVLSEAQSDADVSDSNLALVTAEERGIDQSQLVSPVFEDLLAQPGQQPTANVLRLEQEEELVLQAPAAIAPPVPEPALPVTALASVEPVQNEDEEAEAAVIMPTPQESAPDTEELILASVEQWLNAWQSQQLDDYFAAYHGDFEPRYQDTVNQWRSSRERVIGNAEWIRLRMSEFEIVNQSPELVEVNFWLAYESPSYSDNTLKKLVFEREGEDWLILEEVNLQVTR
ncbi:MAG: AAA family ATPase [Gammaproteobacteria bacterium]